MKLCRIKIENFRRFERQLELKFMDGSGRAASLKVLVGPNMAGKTTILDAIHLAYEMIANLREPNLRRELTLDRRDLCSDPHLPLTIEIGFSLHPGEWEAINEVERLLSGKDIDVPNHPEYSFRFQWPAPDGTYEGVTCISPRNAQLAFRGRSLVKMALARRLAEEAWFEKAGGVLYLDQHRSVELRVPSVPTSADDILREAATSRDILPWLVRQSIIATKWDSSNQGEATWDRIRRLYSDLAGTTSLDDIKATDDGFDLRLRDRRGRYYYSAGMSSGERQLLRLVVNLAAVRATRSVILVDEVELHLHPEWQRNVLHFMRRGGGDDNQFIVTTHSESLLQYVAPEDIILLPGAGAAG